MAISINGVTVAGVGKNGTDGKDATVNGVNALNIETTGGLTGQQIGDTYTIDGSGLVPTTRTVNGKPLSGDIALDAEDVGALPVQYAPKKFTISLEASGWQSSQKTITVEGVTAGGIVLLAPVSKADADTWTDAGVWCTGQGTNSLTFSCESTPSSAIGLNLVILEAAT